MVFEKIIEWFLSLFREEEIHGELYSKKTLEQAARAGVSESGMMESARVNVPPLNPVYSYAVGFSAGVANECKKKEIPKD